MKFKNATLFIFTLSLLTFVKVDNIYAQQGILSEVSVLYLEKLVATAKANYPHIRTLNSQINIAKSDVNIAKISWLDPLSFEYVSRSNNGNTGTTLVPSVKTTDVLNGYQIGMTFNPGIFFTKPSVVKRAKEQVRLAESNQDEYFLSLETLVKTRYFTYLQYQKSLVPVNNAYNDAESNLSAIKLRYQKGEATFLDFNAASNAYSQAFQTKLQIEASYLSAKVALEELTVKRLEDIK